MNSHADIVVVLENVRSAHNVGAIFRTAEAIGVQRILLVGYTPCPKDRFGREVRDIKKTALGAESMVLWQHVATSDEALRLLRTEQRLIVAVERTEGATDYKLTPLDRPLALVFGNEVEGVSQEVLGKADGVVDLPMRGRKESLNIATTVGIVLYRLLDQ